MSVARIVPAGYHSVTPHLVIRGVKQAMEFYQNVFGAEAGEIHYAPDGSIMHAQIQIGDSRIMMAEEAPQWGNLSPLSLGNTPISLHLYFKDVDAVFQQAVAAGATAKMPPMDMFWGDRYAQVVDPFGHKWSLATRIKDMTPEEVAKAGQEFFAKMGGCDGK